MRGQYSGSAPRARGAHDPVVSFGGAERIIPAGAGSTLKFHRRRRTATDHARGRGEHVRAETSDGPKEGSSPRARGARPATGHCRPPLTDHPRGRGEHRLTRVRLGIARGSSPRARGAREPGCGHELGQGIIPAGAGSTTTQNRWRWSWADHPRGRGEHPQAAGLVFPIVGSSPRARGARRRTSEAPRAVRIIPAGAGSTTFTGPWSPLGPDHPRGRGEHFDPVGEFCESLGSSPRARGAHS